MITAILTVFLLYVIVKCTAHFCTVWGLLYYLAAEHEDNLSEEKVRKLRNEAFRRLIKDLRR